MLLYFLFLIFERERELQRAFTQPRVWLYLLALGHARSLAVKVAGRWSRLQISWAFAGL